MTPQDTEVELRPNVSKLIRDRLVGRIYQVALKGETQQTDERVGFFKKVSSKVGIHRSSHSTQARESKQEAAVLLTVESVEVYSGSAGEDGDRSEHSAHDGPQLHPPPSPLEGQLYSYSISMSQVMFVLTFLHPDKSHS